MRKRIKIGNIDLEKELSPFNGHIPFERRELCADLRYVEDKLESALLDIDGTGLVFAEQKDRIYFAIQSGRRGLRRYGKVPAEVQAKGEEAVHAHARSRMEVALEKQRAWRATCERFEQNPDVVVEVTHEGVLLRGRIVRADSRYFVMRIEEPFQAEVKGGGFNWAAAMGGMFMFEVDYVGLDPHEIRLSDEALDDAKRLLISEFTRHRYAETHKDSMAMVDRLNTKRA